MIPSNWPNMCDGFRWWVRYGEMYLGEFSHEARQAKASKNHPEMRTDDTRIVRKPKVIGTSHLEKTHLNLTFCFPMSSGFVFAQVSRIMNQQVEKKGHPTNGVQNADILLVPKPHSNVEIRDSNTKAIPKKPSHPRCWCPETHHIFQQELSHLPYLPLSACFTTQQLWQFGNHMWNTQVHLSKMRDFVS